MWRTWLTSQSESSTAMASSDDNGGGRGLLWKNHTLVFSSRRKYTSSKSQNSFLPHRTRNFTYLVAFTKLYVCCSSRDRSRCWLPFLHVLMAGSKPLRSSCRTCNFPWQKSISKNRCILELQVRSYECSMAWLTLSSQTGLRKSESQSNFGDVNKQELTQFSFTETKQYWINNIPLVQSWTKRTPNDKMKLSSQHKFDKHNLDRTLTIMSCSIPTLTIPPGHLGGQQNFCAQVPGGRENFSWRMPGGREKVTG